MTFYADIRAKLERVPAAKASTRKELFQRLERDREFIHSHADGPLSLGLVVRRRRVQQPVVVQPMVPGGRRHCTFEGPANQKLARIAKRDCAPFPRLGLPLQTYSLVIRTSRNAADGSRVIRSSLDALDRGQPFKAPVRMTGLVDLMLSGSRFQVEVLCFFAVTALVVAAIGLYSLLTYLVSGARREWAIRLALGATAGDLRRVVLGQSTTYALSGVVLGLGAYVITSRLLRTVTYGVSVWSPQLMVSSAVGMVSVCLVAAVIPAARAARVSPSELHAE